MLLAMCVAFASAVLRAQMLQCPTRRSPFVNTGDKAEICCNYAEEPGLPLTSLSWHKRKEDEVPLLVIRCSENEAAGRYACRREGQTLTLEIKDAQVTDSGQYLCARSYHDVYLGSLLIVGDSYTPSTRVTLLQPPAGEPPAPLRRLSPVACLVQGVSNLVQVSWGAPGGLQQGGRTVLVKNSSGSLTFLSLLRVPTGALLGGGSVTCEVRFNASGGSVRRRGGLPTASSAGDCAGAVASVAAAGLLLLLLPLLSLVRKRHSPCGPGSQRLGTEPPSADEPQEELCYAQLDFHRGIGAGLPRAQARAAPRRFQ